MKKILIIIIITLFLPGCYNYIELNDLNIITGIGIDYDQELEKYNITLEIINDKKTTDNGFEEKAYTVNGSGKTISYAIDETSSKVPKIPYFAHIKTVVIDEYIAKNKLNELVDYFLRSPKYRTEFYVLIANDKTAKEIYETEDENNPIVSSYLETLIESDKYSENNSVKYTYDEIVSRILLVGQDVVLNTVTSDNKSINLSGLAIFKDYKMVGKLSDEMSNTYNILSGNVLNARLIHKCENDKDNNIVLSIYQAKNGFSIENNTVIFNGNASGGITENNCDYKLKKVEEYQKLDNEFSKTFNKNVQELMKFLIEKESDILGISRQYNIKNRTNKKNIWHLFEYQYENKVLVNIKGYIFGGEKLYEGE